MWYKLRFQIISEFYLRVQRMRKTESFCEIASEIARGMMSVTKFRDIFCLFISRIIPSFCVVYVLPHFEVFRE